VLNTTQRKLYFPFIITKQAIFYAFQRTLGLKKVMYLSDSGAAQHNKRMSTTNKIFGLCAEWHFFATSHENRQEDGIRGTVRRLAANAKLQEV
jgi:hypothetical protein